MAINPVLFNPAINPAFRGTSSTSTSSTWSGGSDKGTKMGLATTGFSLVFGLFLVIGVILAVMSKDGSRMEKASNICMGIAALVLLSMILFGIYACFSIALK